MTEQTRHLIQTIYEDFGYDKSVRKLNKYGATLSTVQTKTVKTGGKLLTVTRKLGHENKLLGSTIAETTGKQDDFTLAMRRALIVAPVWMAIRQGMMAVLGAIKDIIKTYNELDEGMRKVMAVATFTGETQTRIYGELAQKAKDYFATSAIGMKDITEAMYQLGTAGLSTEQIMGGFEHVLNLAVGTFGNVTTAGRVMAGVFNVFGDELERVGDEAEQMQYVADLLASAWKNNQIELNEINTAMGYLASSGKIVGLGLKELIASAALMSDALLRGGKGGRLLARAFVQISKSGKKLADLGVWFDPTKPLDFYNVMNQLHEIYIKQGRSLDFLNELVGVFGVRGIRAVGAHLEIWEKFNEEITRTPDLIKGTAKALEESAKMTRMKMVTRLWHKMITSRTPPEKTEFRKGLEEMLAFDDKTIKKMNIVKNAMKEYGDKIGLTKKEMELFNKASKEFFNPTIIKKMLEYLKHPFIIPIVPTGFAETTIQLEQIYAKVIANAKKLSKAQKEVVDEPNWAAMTDAVMEITEAEDIRLRKLKEGLKYNLLQVQGLSKTAITMEKITDLLDRRNKGASKLGKTYATIGDVLSLNKKALEGTVLTEDLLKLGAKARLDAETDRQKIIQLLINAQLDELKAQGATLEQRIQAKILFEDSLGKQRDIVEATKNELNLRKAINAQKEIDISLSAQTMKLAQIAEERGVDVAKELGELLQGRVKWAEFEAEAMNETWDALVKFFPQILKQQRAMQLLITGADPYAGRRFEGAREIPIKEEYLRAPLEQNKLMVRALESQMATKEKELQKQTEVLGKQQEIKEELSRQTEILREIDRKKVSPQVKIYFKDKPVSEDQFVVEIKTDGTPIANALDDRIEK